MVTVATCLEDIDRVREVASGAEHAYVARSRLSRLVLRVTNAASGLRGASLDKVVDAETVEWADRLLMTCSELDACRRSATHASEPLDERWQSMWQEMLAHLDTLQTLLENRTLDGV